MKGHGEKLSRNKEKAIAALISCPSIPQAAREVGINENTLWRWLKDSGFSKSYQEARRQVVNQAVSRIQAKMAKAVDTLAEIILNKKALASARVSAAKEILAVGIKAVEIEDLEQRISQIEQYIERENK